MSAVNTLAAIGKDQVADYVSALFTVYFIAIFINVLSSWVPRMPYNRYLRAVLDFVHEVTDPYINVFRSFLKPVGGGGVSIDLSPIVAIIVLAVAAGVIVGAIRGF